VETIADFFNRIGRLQPFVRGRNGQKRTVKSQVFSTNGVSYMEVINHLQPEACAGMEDIRREIDTLDQAIIKLLGKRFHYVLAASKFKTSATSVRAPERFRAMLVTRREWAEVEGLNPDAIEKMYSDLVNHFIAEEMKHWAAHQSDT
jgi:isochorismate pyruvate lyase